MRRQSNQNWTSKWPIVTEEHEQAVLKVLRAGQMSGFEVTKEFEKKYAQALGRKYALAYHNGTAAILGAMYGLGIGVGHEVIAPSLTYWASVAQAYTLGATPVFADVDPDTICIDPKDIEHCWLMTPVTMLKSEDIAASSAASPARPRGGARRTRNKRRFCARAGIIL